MCNACGTRFTTLELPIDGVAGMADLMDWDAALQSLGPENLQLLRALINQMQTNLRSRECQPS